MRALRIYVNDELGELESMLSALPGLDEGSRRRDRLLSLPGGQDRQASVPGLGEGGGAGQGPDPPSGSARHGGDGSELQGQERQAQGVFFLLGRLIKGTYGHSIYGWGL